MQQNLIFTSHPPPRTQKAGGDSVLSSQSSGSDSILFCAENRQTFKYITVLPTKTQFTKYSVVMLSTFLLKSVTIFG